MVLSIKLSSGEASRIKFKWPTIKNIHISNREVLAGALAKLSWIDVSSTWCQFELLFLRSLFNLFWMYWARKFPHELLLSNLTGPKPSSLSVCCMLTRKKATRCINSIFGFGTSSTFNINPSATMGLVNFSSPSWSIWILCTSDVLPAPLLDPSKNSMESLSCTIGCNTDFRRFVLFVVGTCTLSSVDFFNFSIAITLRTGLFGIVAWCVSTLLSPLGVVIDGWFRNDTDDLLLLLFDSSTISMTSSHKSITSIPNFRLLISILKGQIELAQWTTVLLLLIDFVFCL